MDTDKEMKEACKKMGHDIDFVGLDHTFKFGCNRCGACCRGYREDIMLNPYDVYRLSQATGLSGEEVIIRNGTAWIGDNSRVPIFALSHNKSNGWCNFLEFDTKSGKFGCKVNDNKPGSCMNHPVGIVRTMSGSEEDLKFFVTNMCPNHNDTEHTIEEWVEPYTKNLEEHNAGVKLTLYPREYFDTILLCDIIQKTGKYNELPEDSFFRQVEKNETFDSLYALFIGMTLKTLYNFDSNRPFLEQIEERKELFRDGIDTLIDMFSSLGIDLRKKEED